MMMNFRTIIAITSMILCGCASVDNGTTYGTTETPNAAQLVAEKGSVWGAFIQQVATTAIREVDGLAFHGYRHPIKVDDKLYLSPGDHAIGIRVWGSPKGYPPAGTESFACLHFMVEPKGSYILRGFIDGEHFRVEIVQKNAASEKILSSIPILAGIKQSGRICPEPNPPLNKDAPPIVGAPVS